MKTSTFRKSLPLIATSFINKCGSIGLALIPMLLVESHFSMSDSSVIMGVVNGSALAGILLGGYLSDRWSPRVMVLLSFLFSAIGLGFLSFAHSMAAILILGVIASIGNAFFIAPARFLLLHLVLPNEQLESFGWFKASTNLGQVVAFSLGTIMSGMGLPFLFIFDALTSLIALVIGIKALPHIENRNLKTVTQPKDPEKFKVFILLTITSGGFALVYNLFMTGAAAKYKVVFGDQGLPLFSALMVVNTVLCTLLAVPLARFMKRPALMLPFGLILTALGSALAVGYLQNRFLIYLGALILTMGEILFTSVSQFFILRASSKGSAYSLSVTIQNAGRILGGTLAFPLVVYTDNANLVFLLLSLPFIALAFWIIPQVKAHTLTP